jgi:hypothetical protein
MEQGGKPFSRGHLYRLLSNPIYTGQMAHKGELYPGLESRGVAVTEAELHEELARATGEAGRQLAGS